MAKNDVERYANNDEGKLLLRRLYDLSERADNNRTVTASGFFTPAEQSVVTSAVRFFPATPTLDGGYDGAERAVALFGGPPTSGDRHPLAAVEVRHKAPLGHRDLLGSVLGLGLERQVLGDISAGDDTSFMVILRSTLPFLLTHFDKAGRVAVEVCELSLDRFPQPVRRFETRVVTVASPRLDAVTAAAWNLSREDAQRAISSGLVRKNHLDTANPSSAVREGDLLSFKGRGRLKIETLGGLTRRGRLRMTICYYV